MALSRWKPSSWAAIVLVVLLLFFDHPRANRLAFSASVAPKRTALDIICDLPLDVNEKLRNTRKCEEMFPQSVANLSDHRNIEFLKQVAGPQADEHKPREVFCAQRELFQPYIDCVMKSQRDMLKAYAKLSPTELRAVRDGLVRTPLC